MPKITFDRTSDPVEKFTFEEMCKRPGLYARCVGSQATQGLDPGIRYLVPAEVNGHQQCVYLGLSGTCCDPQFSSHKDCFFVRVYQSVTLDYTARY